MAWPRKCCVFVDGENLRHSLVRALPADFDRRDYLPKSALWTEFFKSLVHRVRESEWFGVGTEASRDEMLRAYWYVTQSVEYWPWKIPDLEHAEAFFIKHSPQADELKKINVSSNRSEWCRSQIEALKSAKSRMQSRFDGWSEVHRAIAGRHDFIEFRAAGIIKYDLFQGELGPEKGVDVKLATDMFVLADAYETALIVSGDSDYVPAIQALKDKGKTVVNAVFETPDGNLQPGGSKRLSQHCDKTIRVTNAELKQYLLPQANQ